MKVISKRSKFLGELQRLFSILSYSVNVEDDFETILSHSKNPKEDKRIIEVLEKSSEKIDKEAESFIKHIGTQTRVKKVKEEISVPESTTNAISSKDKTPRRSRSKIKSSDKDVEMEH